MIPRRRGTRRGRPAVLASSLTAVLLAAACTGGGTAEPRPTTGPTTGTAGSGGTLVVFSTGPQRTWDLQRMYIGSDVQFAGRTFARTLTTFSPGPDARLIPDLATDTGTMTEGGKVWTFTLVDNATWQDGKPVTCEDVKYGISRTFAQDVITTGPSYVLLYLDIPTKKDATGGDVPAYAGPYSKEGQDLYDKAVSCTGRQLTLRFKAPWTDFNLAATYPAYAPVRADLDKGAASTMSIFSNGPYQLEGSFDPATGGTFVRNPAWSPTSDRVRKAGPDRIVYTLGLTPEEIYARLLADKPADQAAVTSVSAPPSVFGQLSAQTELRERTLRTTAPYVDYLAPNYRSKVFANEKARQAFAIATDRDAYVQAHGGPMALTPTFSMCNKGLPCYRETNPFGAPTAGDPERAKAVLTEAGLTQPVPITVAYRDWGNLPAAMAALATGWEKAGFDVTLQAIASSGYFAAIRSPGSATVDAFWAYWGADWPSGSTVIGTVFDGRVNITAAGSGSDFGYFNDDTVNKKIDETALLTDPAARERAWGDLDELIAKQGGHVALADQQFVFLHGSRIAGASTNALLGGFIDLATVTVR